jgi:hypothetical protein
MTGSRIGARLWRAAANLGVALGVLLLLLEGFDSTVTERIDWLWFLLAAALLAASWLEKRRGIRLPRRDLDGEAP